MCTNTRRPALHLADDSVLDLRLWIAVNRLSLSLSLSRSLDVVRSMVLGRSARFYSDFESLTMDFFLVLRL